MKIKHFSKVYTHIPGAKFLSLFWRQIKFPLSKEDYNIWGKKKKKNCVFENFTDSTREIILNNVYSSRFLLASILNNDFFLYIYIFFSSHISMVSLSSMLIKYWPGTKLWFLYPDELQWWEFSFSLFFLYFFFSFSFHLFLSFLSLNTKILLVIAFFALYILISGFYLLMEYTLRMHIYRSN